MPSNRVLLIFTGGTISMSEDPLSKALRPIDFNCLLTMMPELKNIGIEIDCLPLVPFIDSSDVQPSFWCRLALSIEENYDKYDGFVILHGTDTMSYSASALSFMCENLAKPIVFTGAQLPIGTLRSDAKENLLTAIEMAAAKEDGKAIVPEVCVFFEDQLFRANRTTKRNAEHFNAFNSYNYPALAKAGVHIKYFRAYIHQSDPGLKFKVHTEIDPNVAILKIFPGMTESVVQAVLNIQGLKAVILETYGAGNAPQIEWLSKDLKEAVDRGVLIINKTQCNTGSVEMGRYETSLGLLKAGVIGAYDCTTEALVTKLMCLIARCESQEELTILMSESIRGEMTTTRLKF